LSGRSDAPGGNTLLGFLARLATEPDALSAFVRDAQSAARRAGLTREDRAVLLSGDQNRIYAALVTPQSHDSRKKRHPRG